ncbi:MAG TPA: peroxidase family protein, partial [Pirellulales bacterium]|nr:peroxidase family protein [Pirellulales bacterium]
WIVASLADSRQILLGLLPNSLEPIGMRTISGELNNLVIGQEDFGATGEFPRLLDPDYRDDGATGVTENPFFGVTNTDYQNSANVVDSDPRLISNLISDQNASNPVAVYAAGLVDGSEADIDGNGLFFIPNVAPDEGLSAPFNSWLTLFGQFFDHGLDLVAKGGSGTVFIPLRADDPLIAGENGIFGDFDDLPPSMRFMTLTRASVDAGPDGMLGTPDDVADATNFTSPFVDQNQTYTSHPSHQIWVRQYVFEDRNNDTFLEPYATGELIEGASGGMATWGEVKAQALQMGFVLTDAEALNIPLFAVDQYGEFIRGAAGFPQIVLADGTLVEGDPNLPIQVVFNGTTMTEQVNGQDIAARTGFSFLLDIAHDANPVDSQTGLMKARYSDGNGNDGINGGPGTYDGDLLDAHFIAGDGRANENIGLTAVHHVFHQEHNRLVEHTKDALLSTDPAYLATLATIDDPTGEIAALNLLNGYLVNPVVTFPTTPLEISSLLWDGDRLFQAAKFGTEMQYQHLVFEEFARKVQPLVDIFASYESSIDAKIVAEFAHTVYRFGHSMLTETVDLMDADGNLTEVGLIEAFLNPFGFHASIQSDGTVDAGAGPQDSSAAAAAIIRGMTRQTGNAIDEFITDALRDNLLGLPLDLGAINIARGRDTGIPTLNDARAEFFAGTGDSKLKPYDSWFDFAQNMKHGGASIVNFIAAYGQQETIMLEETMIGKRAAAMALTTGVTQTVEINGQMETFVAPVDRVEFLTSTNTDNIGTDWSATETGLNLVDFWIGGLAEAIEPFGGMLGSTFNFVFEQQLEDLQDGDRFYYLGRTAGLNFISQLEQNSLANMIVRNTDIGDQGGDHLPGDIFSTPTWILEVDQSKQVTGIPNPNNAPPLIGESGTVSIPQGAPDGTFSVTFAGPIQNAVIVLTINSRNDTDAAVVHVVSSDANGFTARLAEFETNLTALTGPETISWMAVTAGEHTLADGTIIKAGTTTADTTFGGPGNTVTFGTPFAGDPVVLTQVTGSNAGDATEPALVTQIRADVDADLLNPPNQNNINPTTTGFQVRVLEQELNAQDSIAQV